MATAIVLAAQRAGRLDPLAERAGVSHKCLVPIGGAPLIAHVLATLAATPRISEIRIVVEAQAFDTLGPVVRSIGGVPVILIAAADNLADSVVAGADGAATPFVVTTADNVLLSTGAVDDMLDCLAGGAEGAVALATRDAVLAAHPEGQRRFYEFRDNAYSNCNLYALAGPKALSAAEAFRGGGQFAKSAKRIIAAFGLLNLLMLRFKLMSVDTAMKRLSKRFGITLRAVILTDGAHAIDVDNERTYAIVDQLLPGRQREQLLAAE
jgi:GTP:adenosylcobinamide-phosphate guanylyltransferase